MSTISFSVFFLFSLILDRRHNGDYIEERTSRNGSDYESDRDYSRWDRESSRDVDRKSRSRSRGRDRDRDRYHRDRDRDRDRDRERDRDRDYHRSKDRRSRSSSRWERKSEDRKLRDRDRCYREESPDRYERYTSYHKDGSIKIKSQKAEVEACLCIEIV